MKGFRGGLGVDRDEFLFPFDSASFHYHQRKLRSDLMYFDLAGEE